MPLMKLQFQPGLNREVTAYSDEGGWWDADKVRFRMGYPEKIGGWQKYNPYALLGTCRAIHPWVALDGNEYIGFGTSQKYYVAGGGDYNDVTPIRATTAAGDVTFAAARNTLNGGISATATTLTLTSVTGFPTTGGLIRIDSEDIRYSGVDAVALTLTGLLRGQNSTTAASHLTTAGVFCATIVVTDTANDAYANDFVTYSGAASLGGAITAAILNQEYQVTSVVSSTQYTIEARTVSAVYTIATSSGLSPTYVFPNASDTGAGGASTVGTYQINTGLDTTVLGSGWGAGTWGGTAVGGFAATGWGSAASTTVPGAQLRLWGHDNYGQDLLFNVRNGGIYYWAKSTLYPRAVELTSLAGATTGKAPTVAKQVIVSDNDRHVLAFGCDDEFSIGTQDPLLIRFSDSESLTEWRSLPTNSAGSIRIGSGSSIVTAVETKQQTIVITDTSVHALQYLGPPFTFGLTMVSDNVSIAGANAAIAVDDSVYWMGEGDFYIYNGIVSQVPCDVKDYVFSRINPAQTAKIVAGANINFGEVWWFYTSSSSEENDSYVVYNYQQRIWYFGSLQRTAWTHKNLGIFPISAAADKYVYSHEFGTDDGSQNPPVGISAYIESTGQDLGDGDSFAFIWRVIPDLTFRNSSSVAPQATFIVKMSNFPGADFSQENSNVVTKTGSYPVEQFTNQVFTRLRGRSFTFRIESDEAGTTWRLGAPRLDVRTDGRR
jgi:hypothetical protein